MRNCLATKLLSIAMMVLTPAAMLMAETGNTVLYASGNVMLNGKEVTRSASVATGDQIETAGYAATTVNQDGSKVTVNPYSAVKVETAGVNVEKGTAAISTNDGMPAQAAQITVTPKDKTATYEIARLNGNVVITSHTGALMVTDAGATTELNAGASSSRAAEPTPAPAPAPQAAPGFPEFAGSNLSTKQAWIIAAVVGGAAAACGLLCGMAASGQAPLFTSNSFGATAKAVSSHQGRAVNRVVQVARVVAAPAIAGVANSAAANRAPSALRSAQHRNIRAGR
jgi:hypothetical protein